MVITMAEYQNPNEAQAEKQVASSADYSQGATNFGRDTDSPAVEAEEMKYAAMMGKTTAELSEGTMNPAKSGPAEDLAAKTIGL